MNVVKKVIGFIADSFVSLNAPNTVENRIIKALKSFLNTHRGTLTCSFTSDHVVSLNLVVHLCSLKPGEDLDWEEEFALQDFLKNELAERNCGAPERREAAASLPDRCDEEETWTVESEAKEDGGGRDISTPLSAVFLATPTAHPSVEDGRGE